jgi:type II secretion system protein D
MLCSSCFKNPEAEHVSVASRSGCSRAKATAYTGFGILIASCVLAGVQLWAQNQTSQNYIVQASPNPQQNGNPNIAPTIYQAAFNNTNTPNNNQTTPLSTLYMPEKPNQAIASSVVKSNSIANIPATPNIRTQDQNSPRPIMPPNNIPYSPFAPAKQINPSTPSNFPASPNFSTSSSFPTGQNTGANQNQNQNQIFGLNNNTGSGSVITTVGFVTPETSANNSPTTPNQQGSNIPFPVPPLNEKNSHAEFSNVVSPNTNSYGTNNNAVNNVAVANNSAIKSHKLQHLTVDGFSAKLIKKLGQRFVPVQNVGNSNDMVRYRLPIKDGSSVELVVERANGIVTVTGSNAAVDNCIKIVRLLDLPESRDGSVTEFLPVQNSGTEVLHKAANFINQSGQNSIKFVQNQPNPPDVNNDQTKNETAAPTNPAPASNTNDLVNGGNGTILGPVQVNIIEDTFVIIGQPNDVAVVRRIVEQLDKISLEYEPAIELVPIKQADSSRVSQIVQQLYSQIYAQRRGSVTMIPLVKPNTILMVGKKENLDTAKELVNKLDLPVDPRSQFKIFRLKNAQAETLLTQIQQFYQARTGYGGLEQQVNIVADARTNALIVQANPRDWVEVEALIKQLDVDGGEAKSFIKIFNLKNATASELAETLQNIIGSSTSVGNFSGNNNTTQSRNPILVMQNENDKAAKSASTLYDVRISADARGNNVIVSAPPNAMLLIEILIKELDRLPSAESQIKIFNLVNADAYTITTMLQNLFSSTSTTGGFGNTGSSNTNMVTRRPGIEQGESTLVSVRFVAEIRTNSIVAIGSAGDMLTVETILMRLDEENMNNRKILTIKLVNTPATEIAAVIQQYVTGERQLELQNITSYMPQSPIEQYLKEVVIVPEPISNTLIISCTPRFYDQIRNIVQRIDERPRLVAIQGLIAEVNLSNNHERGFEIGLQDSILFRRAADGTMGPGFLFGDNAALPTSGVRAGTVASQGISNLGIGRNGTGVGGFTFSASSESVSILLRALEEKDKVRILSRPQLITLHNMRAVVTVGQRVPFAGSVTTSTYGEPMYSTEWQDVGTVLDLTPRITSDDQIVMSLYVAKESLGSEADGLTTSTGVKTPKINQSKAQTTISAMDGQTVIIGGFITEQKDIVNRSVPVLNKIPVVRHFFEYESQKTSRTELLIILTPTIIRNEADMERLKQREYSRMHWCLNDVVKLTGKSEMRSRTDNWLPCEVPYIQGTPTKLNESQLPPEENIKKLIPQLKISEE